MHGKQNIKTSTEIATVQTTRARFSDFLFTIFVSSTEFQIDKLGISNVIFLYNVVSVPKFGG